MTMMFWPVIVFLAISLAIGLYTYTKVRGSSKNYTVCNKSMPFIVIGTALIAQAVDGNATLGNVSLTWSTGFWVGVSIPIGLAMSLFFVGRFLAAPLNKMDLLTLPEFFYRRYDKQTEAITSALTIVCFTVVIAGNLSAVSWIFSVVSGLSYGMSMVIMTTIIVTYTMAGGLFAAIWTDFFHVHLAMIGFIGSAGYIMWKHGLAELVAKVPPERLDFRGITSMEHGALANWAAIISLTFGNSMALDFMERVFAANSPRTAQRGCYYAAVQTLIIGSSASLLGLAAISLVPTIGDPRMVLPKLAAEHLPFWLGVMLFVGVMGASMSTANGAMLVISVVLARNVYQRWAKTEVKDSVMLLLSRVLAIPTAMAGAWIAFVRPEPGTLLVIAFDIVFAGCVAPLLLGVHWRKATAAGAKTAILVGTSVRAVCYFSMPASLAGLDTLLPPVVSLATMVGVSLMTQGASEQKFERLYNPAPEDRLAVEG